MGSDCARSCGRAELWSPTPPPILAQMGQQQVDMLDSVFAALAHPTRRAIVDVLANGDASVSELARRFEISLTTVAKHLRVLDRAGLVEHQKHGRVRTCRLRAAPLGEADAWIGDYRAFWTGQFDALAAHVGGPASDV
jgi:DNA-binding transcriptional ArsR family regulator